MRNYLILFLFNSLFLVSLQSITFINGSLKFEITAKRLYAASQRVL